MSDVPAEAEWLHCEHHWVSKHQGDFPDEVYWLDQCSLCGNFNGARLAEQVIAALSAAEARVAAVESVLTAEER